MKFVIIIPTYNEAGNVEKLSRLIEKEIETVSDHQVEILFVDGNSPDGTATVIKKLSSEFSNIHLLIEESKQGLGAAYIAGMGEAIKNLKADVIIEMDADFQHSPSDLKRFIVQIDAGADYVIGSRFSSGGSIPKDWSFHRKFLSIAGNLVSKILLNLPSITDYTTGFKASRVRGFLDQIDLNHLASRGFAYKIHLLSEMVDRGAKVREIPIAFANREKGISKMENNNPLDSLRVVLLIRIKKSQRFIKFLGVGFIGLLINFFGLRLFVEIFKFHPAAANLIAAEGSIISNFYWNNRWTFADRKHEKSEKFLQKLFHFNLASAFGVVFIQTGLIFLLTFVFGKKMYVLFFFVATFFLVIFNFTVYNKFIWPRARKAMEK